MAIYMKIEGIKGNVSNTGNGGVWKTTNFLEGGTTNRKRGIGALDNLSGSNTWGGIYLATDNLDSAALSNVVEVSGISSLPDSSDRSLVINGRDANAVVKVRRMFESQRSSGTFTLTFKGQVTGPLNNVRRLNDLRQIATTGRTVPMIGIFVGNPGNSQVLAIKLQDCLVSSYSVSGSSSASGDRPMESLSVNYTKITYNY